MSRKSYGFLGRAGEVGQEVLVVLLADAQRDDPGPDGGQGESCLAALLLVDRQAVCQQQDGPGGVVAASKLGLGVAEAGRHLGAAAVLAQLADRLREPIAPSPTFSVARTSAWSSKWINETVSFGRRCSLSTR